MKVSLVRQAAAEFIGTLLLVSAVVGSGIMAASLTDDIAVALLANTFSTIFALGVLIFLFLPISGAQFNPAVSLVLLIQRHLSAATFVVLSLAQILGAIAGAVLANLMFALPAVDWATTDRATPGKLLGEAIATAGLVFLIVLTAARSRTPLLALLVPAWIGAAYFFTSSTSFANPAVTIGRMFSDTFAGIAPSSAPVFIVFQLIGALVGLALALAFIPKRASVEPSADDRSSSELSAQ